MSPDLPLSIVREGFGVLATIGGPLLGALLAVGLVVGLLQAATQINDPVVGFLPRLVTAMALAWVGGGWAMELLGHFFATALNRMAQH